MARLAPDDVLLNTRLAAREAGLSHWWIKQLCRRGSIGTWDPLAGQWRIGRRELRDFLRHRPRPGRPKKVGS